MQARQTLRVDSQHKLQRWEKRTEWPLAIIAVIFLAAYAVEVLAQPHGAVRGAIDVVTAASYVIFAADYVMRLALAPNRRRWFFRHLIDLLIVLLPLLRPFVSSGRKVSR